MYRGLGSDLVVVTPNSRQPRVCIVTAGHLSTCPRMLKAADALCEAGYAVRVVSTSFMPWAAEADLHVRRTRSWRWTVVDYTRESGGGLRIRSGLRFRAARSLAAAYGAMRCPLPLVRRAVLRMNNELMRAALSEPADLYLGGGGALAPTAMAARRSSVPYALDLEDFHSAEQEDSPQARLSHALIERVEADVLPGASFLTAGSEAIADAYIEKYGIRPTSINNTFPLPKQPPLIAPRGSRPLTLYWFSQTVGPNRGLEDIIIAAEMTGLSAELHVRGQSAPGYVESLKQLTEYSAPGIRLVHHAPKPPDEMIKLCGGYDVGLALEQPRVFNRSICLTNKAFTYMHAGLAMALTDTLGQRPILRALGDAAIGYKPGGVATLAEGLKRWDADDALLQSAKQASWNAARVRWHWEHPLERGALLGLVANTFGTQRRCA